MSTESTNYSEPTIDVNCLNAVVGDPALESEGKLWDDVHEEVQRALSSLDEPVQAKVANTRVTAGMTRGRGFYLFTYRTFSRTDAADIDPVVAGLTFTAADDGAHVAIRADISGESGGDVIGSLAPREVPVSRGELLHAAAEAAHQLCERRRSIAEALLDSSRAI